MSFAGITKEVRPVVAFWSVFHPTNVQPVFVAFMLKSTGCSTTTLFVVAVLVVPPFAE